ncbi:MAG: hypothetical protein NWE80_03640 [Candidatus Bathyarchaeota archaeon]|nr:hypothetical protein [Candidatus Bathyarchaeota archaeon]
MKPWQNYNFYEKTSSRALEFTIFQAFPLLLEVIIEAGGTVTALIHGKIMKQQTLGIFFSVEIRLHDETATERTAYMKINGLDQCLEADENWGAIEFAPAGERA